MRSIISEKKKILSQLSISKQVALHVYELLLYKYVFKKLVVPSLFTDRFKIFTKYLLERLTRLFT